MNTTTRSVRLDRIVLRIPYASVATGGSLRVNAGRFGAICSDILQSFCTCGVCRGRQGFVIRARALRDAASLFNVTPQLKSIESKRSYSFTCVAPIPAFQIA